MTETIQVYVYGNKVTKGTRRCVEPVMK